MARAQKAPVRIFGCCKDVVASLMSRGSFRLQVKQMLHKFAARNTPIILLTYIFTEVDVALYTFEAK